jgi:hypothetical protein
MTDFDFCHSCHRLAKVEDELMKRDRALDYAIDNLERRRGYHRPGSVEWPWEQQWLYERLCQTIGRTPSPIGRQATPRSIQMELRLDTLHRAIAEAALLALVVDIGWVVRLLGDQVPPYDPTAAIIGFRKLNSFLEKWPKAMKA